MSQTKAQLLDNIKDNVQLDARNSLRFADTDSSHYVAFKAPATVSSNVTWTLPAADGSANYVLATDGSGTLSWIADPAGQWVTSGSNIYFTGGNVGIGDSSPSNPLSVTGASAFNGDVTFTGASYNITWDKSADDLIFNDNAKAAFGTSSDLLIWHDGSHSYIDDSGTGALKVRSSSFQVLKSDGSEYIINTDEDDGVDLYFNGVKKFETTTNGCRLGDGVLMEFGDNGEFTIDHGANTNTHIKHTGAGDMYIQSVNDILFRNNTTQDVYAHLKEDGAVELYFDATKKFETTTLGTTVSGNVLVKSTAFDPDNDAFDAADYPLVVQNPEDTNGDSTGIGFAVTTAADKVGAAIHHVREGGGSQGDMRFLVSSDGNSITERMRINSNGIIQPYVSSGVGGMSMVGAFMGRVTAVYDFPAGTRKIALATEEFDANGWFDHTSNYRYTPLCKGWYQVHFQLQFKTGIYDTAIEMQLTPYFNGAALPGAVHGWDDNFGNYAYINYNTMIYFDGVDDYLEMYGNCSSATDVSTSTRMMGFLVHPIA